MWDAPDGTGRGRVRRPAIINALIVALALSLAVLGYLLWRPDVRALAFSPITRVWQAPTPTPSQGGSDPEAEAQQRNGSVSSAAMASAGGETRTSGVPAEGTPGGAPPDLNVMIVQLQEMHDRLLAMSSQLEQKGLAARLVPPATPTAATWGSPAQLGVSGEDIPALLAEIERLYQVMQPLMVQMDIASKSPRPASELDAMRSQMSAVHQRLSELIARAEAGRARADTTAAAGTDQSPLAAQSDLSGGQATYEQLLQTMNQLQATLQQMQSQGGGTSGWVPGPLMIPFWNSDPATFTPGGAHRGMGGH